MIQLKELTIQDKPLFDQVYHKYHIFNGDYNFANLFAWQDKFHTKFTIEDGFFIVMAIISEKAMISHYPFGEGDPAAMIEKVHQFAWEKNRHLSMGLLDRRLKDELEQKMPETFDFFRERDSDDYVYEAEKLKTLSGKKLHAKRNMLNGFLSQYSFAYREIEEKDLIPCREFCLAKAFSKEEEQVIRRMFDNFYALGLTGACLTVDGRIVAVTVAEFFEDSVMIHIEKADSSLRGAYAAINQQFLQNSCPDILYVNREDDMGLENLRKAKLAYRPAFMIEKYTANYKKE